MEKRWNYYFSVVLIFIIYSYIIYHPVYSLVSLVSLPIIKYKLIHPKTLTISYQRNDDKRIIIPWNQHFMQTIDDSDPISQELNSNVIGHIEIKTNYNNILESTSTTNNNFVSMEELDANRFGDIFRQCAPYIAMHRNSIVVIHINSHLFDNRELFDKLFDDISILHLLGIQIVLVVGVRKQLDKRIIESDGIPLFHNGVRISNNDVMKYLKEISGFARFEVESALARGYRGRPGQSGINVVSGNFFYTAKPFGVRGGIDYQLTGEVRKIEATNINKRLESGDIVLLTSLGYSPSGEVFNIASELLAAETAACLHASKIIFLTNGEVLVDNRNNNLVQNLRLGQASALYDNYYKNDSIIRHNYKTQIKKQDGISISSETVEEYNEQLYDFLNILSKSIYALNHGVKRAHLIQPSGGSLLKELYTQDGSGMLISCDVYEGIRVAQPSDLRDIEQIIQPLCKQDILVPRSRGQLEKDLANTFVLNRDGITLALGMLKVFDDYCEICCLAVDPRYRRKG